MKSQLLLLSLSLSLLAAAPAAALDPADAGTFALVHNDGRVTDKVARLSRADGRWRLEERQADGSWEDITCEEGCALVDSTPEQVAGFQGKAAMTQAGMSCVHDMAFAFCGSGDAAARSYHMLAFVDGQVIPLKWVRVDPDTLKPAAP